MVVHECKPDAGGFKDCGVVFSGLDQDVAGDIGESQLCLVWINGHRGISREILSIREEQY